MTSLAQLQQLEKLGVDYAGLIFYEGSKRFVGEKLQADEVKRETAGLKKVGVFVNADLPTVKNTIENFGLHAVQLHGDDTVEYCAELMNTTKVIKVFRISGQENIEELTAPFRDACHYFLFDSSPVPDDSKLVYGGTGRSFDWDLLKSKNIGKPFFLSGGIGPGDAESIRLFRHPDLYGTDVNSRFETAPGIKDLGKIEQFIKALTYE
jgi:phosphoribosylanthranilate isomerase